MNPARTFLVLCGLFCLAASFKSAYFTLDSYNNQQYILATIPVTEPFVSGFYVSLYGAGDIGIYYYDISDPAGNLANSNPTEFLYLVIYNDRNEYLVYQWLGGNGDRILTTINAEACPTNCVFPGNYAQSYNGVGQSGAALYGYLYIPDRVAGPFLSGVSTLSAAFGWGSGVSYLTNDPLYYRSPLINGAQFFLSFNPAVLVGDPHLQTDIGYQQSITTIGGVAEESYALYCDQQGNWINGVVHNTLAGAYILTELELSVTSESGSQYSISGYRDAAGMPFLRLNSPFSYDFETYLQEGIEHFRYDLKMMTWVQSDDPEFDGELARYYRRVLHIFYQYNSGNGDIGRITIRVGFHPQMKGFFEVLVSPIPEYLPVNLAKADSQTHLHTRGGVLPVNFGRPGGLLYKDPGDSLATFAIPDIAQSVCISN